MKTSLQLFKKSSLAILFVLGLTFAPAQQAQAGYPVIDLTHIQTSAQNLATNVSNTATQISSWAKQVFEAVKTTLFLKEIFEVSEVMKDLQTEIMEGLGTVQDIMAIPSNVMQDLFSVVGSVQDTIMDAAGVAGIWGEIQGVFGTISEVEAFGRGIASGDALDFGNFGNAAGALSAVRGAQTRTAVEYLNPNRLREEQRTLEKIIGTFEDSENAAEIAKGNAQINAAIEKQVRQANQLQAMDVQRRTAEGWSREAQAEARASASKASTMLEMTHFLD